MIGGPLALANKICNESGCHQIAVRGEGKCSAHRRKPWAVTSKRNLSRPKDWNRRRRAVLKRDAGVCYLCGLAGANEVDHVTAVADNGGWDYGNLRSAHRACHAAKSSRDRARR
ncbi:HNH endonuclease [Nonomuraea roseoviolacea]|uniref:HNH endonuclease n=1 Tax=Nonomuraea roseoviolacea TaxID=103837 RepID=UPI0033893D36